MTITSHFTLISELFRYILDLVKWMDADLLKMLTPKLLSDSPNTYAYTKCLTEHLVSEYQDKLPIVICRPSIGN